MNDTTKKLEAQKERYAGTAMVAIELLGVLEAHLSYLSASDRSRLMKDLNSRGLGSINNQTPIVGMQQLLGLIARGEG